MTMDFSQLHSYTPPECDPDNTGYTYSLSSSYSKAALEFEKRNQIDPVYDSPRMSRRSMRSTSASHHGDESLVDSSNICGRTYSLRNRETRVQQSRRPRATASSVTLAFRQCATSTPRTTIAFSTISTPIGSNNTETDGFQLNSALEQSLLSQQTISIMTTDEHLGHSAINDSSNFNGNTSITESHNSPINGFICNNCSTHPQLMDTSSMESPSQSTSFQAAATGADLFSSTAPPFTNIYTRDRRQRNAGIFTSFMDTVRRAGSSSVSHLWMLKHSTLHRMLGHRANGDEGQGTSCHSKAHSSFCGSMNVKELMIQDESHLNLNGSLCDDCKGKRYAQTHSVHHTQSSRSHRLVHTLWSSLLRAGDLLNQPGTFAMNAGHALGSGVRSVGQSLLPVLETLVAAPVSAATEVLRLLATGWYQLVYLMSVLNVFFLTRILPKRWILLWILLPLLFILALWLWGPSFRFSSPAVPVPVPVPVPFPVPVPDPESERPRQSDLERLKRVEHQLALLIEQVQQRDQRVDSWFGNMKEQLHTLMDKQSLGLWVSSLLEQRIVLLRGELDQENTLRAQSTEERLQWQQAAQLADMELLIKAHSDKTEEVQQKQLQFEHNTQSREKEGATPSADGGGVKQEEHNALLTEVHRLELELGKIRLDLQGVVGCKGRCEQLDMMQEKISSEVIAQMRKELHALSLGKSGSGQEQGEVPESLILWLSQRYVTTPDLQESLTSLEMKFLRKISLVQSRTQTQGEADFQAENLNEKDVKLIVKNALNLYSQDRTGLVDYALESGGGSILSTRCSETYETKTALMSLFGLPLLYFSQSPRVVIQPDVYPGNCWAFKGSQGYLVIRLSMNIVPSSFSLEHIPKTLSPTGNITSAPRDFIVFGLDDEYQEEGKLLGQYAYQEDGESLQTFLVQEQDRSFQIIEVRVLSNWGHPDYTCLYRFRVHGKPAQ